MTIMGFLALFGCSQPILTRQDVNMRIETLAEAQDERFLKVIDAFMALQQVTDALLYLKEQGFASSGDLDEARQSYNVARYYQKKADTALMEGKSGECDRYLALIEPESNRALNLVMKLLKKVEKPVADEPQI